MTAIERLPMKRIILRAGVISMAGFAATQLIRFGGNIVLAKLLAPSAFGVVAVVNMVVVGINLLSDIGIRLIIVQRQGEVTADFLNTVWVMQIVRGWVIWALALLGSLALLGLQTRGLLAGNTYADPLLPYLMIAAASSAVFQGFESTKKSMHSRAMSLGVVTAMALASQVLAMLVMLVIAYRFASPWALVAGGVVASLLSSGMSHMLPGQPNRWHFDWSIALEVLRKGRWVVLGSTVTFLATNSEVIILGGLVDAKLLGNYVIAFLIANVVYMVSTTLAGNVIFPALSAMARVSDDALGRGYVRMQLISDALILSLAGILLASGKEIIQFLFDQRYAMAGEILVFLSLGLIGLRYHVVEQLMAAHGRFKLISINQIIRLVFLIGGIYIGFHINGLPGAARAVGLSWFAGWPICLWYRGKNAQSYWRTDLMGLAFLAAGYGLGTLLVALPANLRQH